MSQSRVEIRLGSQAGSRLPVQVVHAKDARATLQRLWGYLKVQRWLLIAVVILVALATGFSLLVPYLVGIAIDRYIPVGDLTELIKDVALIAAIAVANALVVWLYTNFTIRLSQHTVRDLRRDSFAKLQLLPLRFFDTRPHGEIMSYLTNDIDNISLVLTENVTTFISAVMIVVGMVITMLLINVPLAIISIIVFPFIAYFTRFVASHTRQGFREQQESLSVLNGHIEETVTGGKVIRAFGREQASIIDFDQKNERLRKAATYAQTYGGLLGPGGNLIYNIGFVLIAGTGGWLALNGHATVGIIATFLTYTQQIRRPLNDLSNMFNTIQSAIAGAERVFSILDEPNEFPNTADAKPLQETTGAVTFDAVSFGYRPDVPTLKQIDFDIQPGQTIALVGPTGAGKTTIINLLTRFYDVDSGSIRLDGSDLRIIDKYDLRRKLGIVLQDSFMFSETVMENIRYGRLNATDDEVIAAATLANADHFIRRLPKGYQEVLSERAENLSQGQRQLLAIARAILADPAILILDEATSSVDTRTEILVQEAMRRLMKGRTSFVIAHRLSTIREADLILFIRDGKIAERGNHDELLAQRGLYYNLYMSQFKVGLRDSSPTLDVS
jgi:ATP-binding cassette subfamily B protein